MFRVEQNEAKKTNGSIDEGGGICIVVRHSKGTLPLRFNQNHATNHMNTIALANVSVSPSILATLATLENDMVSNRFTAIDGYRNEQGEVANFLIRAATSCGSVYGSTLDELNAVTFESLDADALAKWVPSKGKNSFATAREQFNFCMEAKRASILKTLSGDRSGAHREGHDRCSRSPLAGVTLDLVTEKREDGLMHPITNDKGEFIAKGLRLHGVVIQKAVITEGEKKVVNSGSKVLMDSIIEKAMNAKRVALRTFSLMDGKFEAVRSGSLAL